MPTTETNTTVTETINVIDNIDMDLGHTVQGFLAPIYERFPFLSESIFGIPFANLIAAIVVFSLILMLRKFFTFIVMEALLKLSQRTANNYDEKIISVLKGPLSFAFVVIALHLFFILIFKETETVKKILNTMIIFDIFWAIIAIADALRDVFHHATSKFNPDLAKEMGNFILKILKIFIGGIGLAAMLQVWGINVTALIASLGLGGLAFALAARDTAANLFGSFAILADKSIRIGEWIKVDGVEGVVEDIGMRTTKVRSFEKSLITVPNSIVANASIENFSRRGVRRIKMHIGLTYGTTSSQILKIKEEIEAMLRNHEGISQKESLLVYFDTFGASSLDIFIYTFTQTADWAKYLEIREDIHIKIMQIVESNGSGFAFPSQSIYVESLPSKQ